MSAKAKVGATICAAVLAVALQFTPPQEGRVKVVYRDVAGNLTACDGHTGPELELGQAFTDEECNELLAADLTTHYDRIARCLPLERMGINQQAAMLDLEFNTGAVCFSTLPRWWNAGDAARACATIESFYYAGWIRRPKTLGPADPGLRRDCRIAENGCRGIIRRRSAERALCERADS